MTTLALAAKVSTMNVVRSVTVDAIIGHLDLLRHRRAMAGRTRQLLMRSSQSEIGRLVVIEPPARPGVRVVTLLASWSERFLVHVVRGMARLTGDVPLLETVIPMTGLASRHGVKPP